MFTVKGHYKRGEILYVRESHYCFGNWFYGPKNDGMGWTFYPVARGTDEPHTFEQPEKFHISRDKKNPQHPQWYKRLARFMPKAYARTFLEVVSVRVERLQNISEVDAFAEGVIFVISMEDEPAEAGGKPFLPGRAAFRKLWEEINGTGSWNANPWVWVIEFKRISP